MSSERLIGRKLYIKWWDKGYVAIEKIPDGAKKISEIDLVNKEEGLMLCNVYEDENGEKKEIIIGTPSLNVSGHKIGQMFTDDRFWKTLGEDTDY